MHHSKKTLEDKGGKAARETRLPITRGSKLADDSRVSPLGLCLPCLVPGFSNMTLSTQI